MEKVKERNYTFDLIRIVAIVAVLWIHCQEQAGFNIHIVSTMTYLFGRMGVPLFLMLTGALLIKKCDGDVIDFYATHLIPMYFISVFWMFVYRFGDAEFGEALKKSFNLIASAKHLWYLPVLITIYVAMPFLVNVKNIKPAHTAMLLSGIFILSEAKSLKLISLTPGFIVSVWFGYVIFGYYAAVYLKKLKNAVYISAVGTVISAALFYYTKNLDAYKSYFSHNKIDIWWYDSPFIVITAMFLFVCLSEIKIIDNQWLKKVLVTISQCSFGMYAVHLWFIIKIFPRVKKIVPKGNMQAIVLFAVVFIFSFIFSYIAGKIPGARFFVHQKKRK